MRASRRAIAFLLLLIFLPHATGCSVPLRELPPSSPPGQPEGEIRGVILYDSTRYEFDRRAQARWEDSTLVVAEPEGEPTRYPQSQIYRLLVERAEDRTGVMIARVVVVGILIAAFFGIMTLDYSPDD